MNVGWRALPAAFLLALALGHDGDGQAVAAASSGFAVYHYLSEQEGRDFREVFIVDGVRGLDVAIAEVELLRDGAPLAVQWVDDDGRLGEGDRFSFVQEAFDAKQVLTAQVHGRQVMHCMFGGGAGLPFTPQEWREMGHPEMVRCLQLTDDQ